MKISMAKTVQIKESVPVYLEIFGDSPINRVLDYLVIGDDFDHSMTDIAEGAEIGYTTLKQMWPDLERNRIIKQTRQVGKAKMYKMNMENVIVQKFKRFYWDVCHEYVKMDLK